MSSPVIQPRADRLTTTSEMLQRLKPQMRAALPKHLSPERMARIALTTVRRTPQLLECAPISLAGAIIQACQLGLEPDGALGEFWLTPRRIHGEWNVVGISGYRGLMKLARQSGDIDWIIAHAVYQKDEFSYQYGDDPRVHHKPGNGLRDPKTLTYCYAIARYLTGSKVPWVMERAQIDEVRDRYAAAKDAGPWITHYAEMGMKSAIRRLCKQLPQSALLGRAITLDEQAEAGIPQGLDALVEVEELGMKRPSKLHVVGAAIEEANTQAADAAGVASDEAASTRAPVSDSSAPVVESAAPALPPRTEDRPAGGAPPPRRSRARFPKIPEEVEKPKGTEVPAPSWTEDEPTGAPEADTVSTAVADTGQEDRRHGDRGASSPLAFPPVTASNTFDLLQLAQSGESLDLVDEHVKLSEVFRAWPEPQRKLWREAVRLARTRLPAA